MNDSSIRAQAGNAGHGYEQCEFVTPVCTIADIPVYQECIRALRKAGAKVNSSCGCHIHVDAANHDAQSLKNLVFLFKSKQDLIFKAVGTQQSRLNQWCRPVEDKLVSDVKANVKKGATKDQLGDVWYQSYGTQYTRTSHYNPSRYHALNLHSCFYRGTVEFRCFEASLHAGKIRAWLMLCLGMSAYAINKESVRVMNRTIEENEEKYTMRTWLWQMGFIGDEFVNIRKHLLENLSGPEYHISKHRQRNNIAC